MVEKGKLKVNNDANLKNGKKLILWFYVKIWKSEK